MPYRNGDWYQGPEFAIGQSRLLTQTEQDIKNQMLAKKLEYGDVNKFAQGGPVKDPRATRRDYAKGGPIFR